MLEIAGVAVGVVSLGIQVTDGLIDYYKQFRHINEDIQAVLTRIEGLRDILNALAKVTHQLADPNNPARMG